MLATNNAAAAADREPTIAELMADPIFDLLMRRDGLTRPQVQGLVERAAARLAGQRAIRWGIGADLIVEPALHG